MKIQLNEFKTLLIGFIVAGSALVSSCDYYEDDYMDDDLHNFSELNGPCLRADGSILTETRDLDSFHSIWTDVVAKIELTQGSPQEVKIEGYENILDVVETNVADGVLVMRYNQCVNNRAGDELKVTITLADLNNLTLSGVGDIISQNDLDLEDLAISMSGVGNITLKGKVQNLDITSSGVGGINSFDLTSQTTTVSSSGVGDVKVTVIQELNAYLSGMGNVLYKGHPSVNASVSGFGKVIDAN